MLGYLERSSFMHRMDAALKFVWCFVITFLVFTIEDPLILGILLATQIGIALTSQIPLKTVLKSLSIILGVMAFIFLFHTIFYPFGKTFLFQSPWLSISLEGVLYGAGIALRIPNMVIPATIFVLTTDQRDFAFSLVQVLKVPYKIGYMLYGAFRFAPLMDVTMHNIMDAHKVRGVDLYAKAGLREKLRRWKMMLIPFIVSMWRMAGEVAIAMESRAFGAHEKITFIEEIRVSKKDVAFIMVWILLAIVIVALGLGSVGELVNRFIYES